jgi:transcriptional regulator with GAF, ATPase, and Fis domain
MSELQHPLRAQTEMAQVIHRRSLERWGAAQPTFIIGRHESLESALQRIARLADSDAPVLITGETGTGKELFARALYLLSKRNGMPFLTVNCAQYFGETQLIASELFGHRKGSFTGAVSDHRGVFEEAQRGVVFLDEIGELSPCAQAMLLRALSEGEILPVGETRSRRVDVRVVAATNRDLKSAVDAGRFRVDLYYRLRYLQIQIPPVRERGGDWELILDHYLRRLGAARSRDKAFSREAVALLRGYHWPGNVRELRGLVDTAFHLSEGDVIEPHHFAEALEDAARAEQLQKVPLGDCGARLFERIARGEGTFWDLVHLPYLDRQLSRGQVRELIAAGLTRTRGSYKKLLALMGLDAQEYLKFMDFLRHHRLKPDA